MSTILILNAVSSLIAAAGLTAIAVRRRARAAREIAAGAQPVYVRARG